MGNITKIEDRIALSSESGNSHPESVNPAQQSTSELIEWKCIHNNGTTPFIRSYDIAAFSDNQKIYFFDGKTGGNLSSPSKLFIYDVGTKQFEIFSVEGQFKKLGWLQKIGNKVYFILDGYLNIYDIESKKTTNDRQPLPTIARNVFHDNQSIYVFNFRTTAFQFWIYDIKQGTWRSEQFRWPSSMNRHPAPAISLVENELYAFAGSFEANSYSDKLYKFSFENKEWTVLETKGDTPIGVSGHALASLNIQGVPHLISLWGYNGQYQNVLQILNLKTLAWEVTQIPHKRTMTSLVSVDNVLYAMGGCSRDDNNHFKFYNDIHVIKPKDWSLKGLCLNVIRAHIDNYEETLLNQLPSDVKDLI